MSNDPNSKFTSFSTIEKLVLAFAVLLATLGFVGAGSVLLDVLWAV